MTDKLTIRDQFAMAALSGLCADPKAVGKVRMAYDLAEQMLVEKKLRDDAALLTEIESRKNREAIKEKVLRENSDVVAALDELNKKVWLNLSEIELDKNKTYDVKVSLGYESTTDVVYGVKNLPDRIFEIGGVMHLTGFYVNYGTVSACRTEASASIDDWINSTRPLPILGVRLS